MSTAGDVAQDIAEVGIPIVVLIIGGAALGWSKIFPTDKALPYLNKFVFYLGIPALVFKGLAINDFVNDEVFNWDFICAFLVLRAVIGLISLSVGLLSDKMNRALVYQQNEDGSKNPDWIGTFLVLWISETYMNTLIFGIPILQAIYGNKSLIYNVFASLSSLFFQLPVLLLFFEYHNLPKRVNPVNVQVHDEEQRILNDSDEGRELEVGHMPDVSGLRNDALRENQTFRQKLWLAIRFVLISILSNPPMIGILLGMTYSLAITSTTDNAVVTSPIGKQIKPLALNYLLTWLGDTVTPLASFCIGLFAAKQGNVLWKNIASDLVLLLTKFLFVPILMIPILLLFGLENSQARIGVLIAALPIALAGFTLCENYHVGAEYMSSQIIWGTILMIPVTIAWDAFMESVGLFGADPLRG